MLVTLKHYDRGRYVGISDMFKRLLAKLNCWKEFSFINHDIVDISHHSNSTYDPKLVGTP